MKNFLVGVTALLLATCNTWGQSLQTCNIISMSDTFGICKNNSDTLRAIVSSIDSIYSIHWSPSVGLSDSDILDPVVAASASGWYHLIVTSLLSGNLVINGNFNSGDSGFTSSYTYNPVAPPSGSPSIPDDFNIGTDPYVYNNAWPVFGDHTTGTGNMMLIDAALTGGQNFWCESLPVSTNSMYVFSVWTALLYPPQPEIQVSINGVYVGTFFTSAIQGEWVENTFVWNSGTSTTASICMTDLNTTQDGNDFAVDDISFREICITSDSIYIDNTIIDTTHQHFDTSLCSGLGNININAPTGYSAYAWNTSNTTPSISVDSGQYWVIATKNCTASVDSFLVTRLPEPYIYLPVDTFFCRGNTLNIHPNAEANVNFMWSTGSTDSVIQVASVGVYSVTISDSSGCKNTANISVNIIDAPVVSLGSDTTLCNGDELTLSVPSGSALWSNDSVGQSMTVATSGKYWVRETNECGVATDSINVSFELCDLWFPSAFTPNSNGINDIARVRGTLTKYTNFSLSIYNRWGERVFYTSDIYQGWDGKFRNTSQDIGTYFYMINYMFQGKKHLMKGDLELIK